MNNLNLENIKIGDEITTIRNENGKTLYQGLWIVSEWSEKHGGFRLIAKRNDKLVGILPKDGKGYYAMHSREKPHFYYSANPAHIKKAKESIKRAEKAREKKEKLRADKLAIIHCFSEEYHDKEEGSFPMVSIDTLERLSFAQLKKLKSWLDGEE